MLNSIQSSKATSEIQDAVSHLQACHDRIRHFMELATKLADTPSAPALERADAAGALRRYYTVALPLHEADENESVYPRLKTALASGPLAEANQEMIRQHVEIDATVAKLVPMWQQIERAPQSHAGRARLQQKTRHLEGLWQAHLKLEEEIVFPAIRSTLSPREQEAILLEMRKRRF